MSKLKKTSQRKKHFELKKNVSKLKQKRLGVKKNISKLNKMSQKKYFETKKMS
jgi:hypothetical protein